MAIASVIPLVFTVALAQRPSLVGVMVPRLVFLAAGALLGAAVFHLIPEALETGDAARVATLVLAGIAAFALFERVVHARRVETPHQLPDAVHVHDRRPLVGLTVASDALHNLIDGILIASAFLARPSLGVITGVAIALHELPRELGTFAVCVRSGMTVRRAILVNVATGLLSVAGAIGTLLVGVRAGQLGAVLVPFAAGNFLYLSAAILWAERESLRSSLGMRDVGFVGFGVLVTALLARH